MTDIKTSQWVTEKGTKVFWSHDGLLNGPQTCEDRKSLIRKMSTSEKAYAGIGLHLISSKRGMKTMMINSSLFWSLAIFQFVFTWWESKEGDATAVGVEFSWPWMLDFFTQNVLNWGPDY